MIKSLKAREILDSRGNPTVEVLVETDDGSFTSSVPSGASTGKYEAKEIRDGGERYMGKGTLKAVENINRKIAPLLIGKDVDPFAIDKILIDFDGTKDKSNLGANAILGVSMALFRAGAGKEKVSLYQYLSSHFNYKEKIPVPCFNIVNGGMHTGGGVSFQEFMLVPGEESFKENLRFAVEFYNQLKKEIVEKYGGIAVNIGDEGGFVPPAESAEDILLILQKTGKNSSIIIDAAASEFFEDGSYFLDGVKKNLNEIIEYYKNLQEKFSLLGIEDPLEEDDFSGWSSLKKELEGVLLVGDDLLATNTERMKLAHEADSCNAMILKVNQIGSITEAVEAVRKAKEYGWKIIVSHRSGETNDDFIADFAVGVGADYIKSGAPVRGERVSKYNRLLKIEDEIKN